MRNSSNLDGIRTIAVLLVVMSHIALLLLTAGNDHAMYSFRAMGHVGVAIFFVHTTLVLMASLERHGSVAIPFYVRRILRIYPLSVAVVLFIALLRLASDIPFDKEHFLSNLFLVQNIANHKSTPDVLWSLPFEVQMYLVLPAIFQITKTRHPVVWASLLFAASLVAALILPPTSLAYRAVLFVPCFLPGVLAFVLLKRVQAHASPIMLFSVILGVGVLGVPMLVAAGVPEIPLLWGLCLVIGLTIPRCRQFTNPPLAQGSKVIATYSYGIYLTHTFALGIVGGSPEPTLIQWVAMLILLPGLAYLCYHGIEKHGVALGSRISRAMTSKRQEFPGSAGIE